MEAENCRFCDILKNTKIGNRESCSVIPLHDTVLYETDNFLVLPALGAIVSGYIMIISRAHVYSMAELSQNHLEELQSLLNCLRGVIMRGFKVQPIVFEHGSAPGCFDIAANSVNHAHFHVVPIGMSQEDAIIRDSCAIEIPNIHSICAYKEKPYFLYINDKDQFYLSQGKILESQYMRRWVANEAGIPLYWDWRKFEFIDNVAATVEHFLGQTQSVLSAE